MTAERLCIYHGGCADGFGAAWVVHKFYKMHKIECDFYAGVYDKPPPDVSGRTVTMVDFSYKRPVLEMMLAQCESLLVIDHHKTAQEDLNGIEHERFSCIFDMNHSGAMLTWLEFFPDAKPPVLLRHIQDRDLWRFKLPSTREIIANLFTYPQDFATWDTLMQLKEGSRAYEDFIQEGFAIERKIKRDVESLIPLTMRWLAVGGFVVPVCNVPHSLASDVGHKLCETAVHANGATPAFGASYYDTEQTRVFSLRSVGDFDVSAVAKLYGGGGHKNAAGFSVPLSHPLAQPWHSIALDVNRYDPDTGFLWPSKQG